MLPDYNCLVHILSHVTDWKSIDNNWNAHFFADFFYFFNDTLQNLKILKNINISKTGKATVIFQSFPVSE